MEVLDLSRLQFGATTVYHFLFVPLTIGLAFIVAAFQTAWHRTGDDKWFKLTKLFGKLFLINFAMGVVTGIVQEFQFGMNWSAFTRNVGDIFGAPLALEGLLAFFLESTFLGLWIFGWDRLPRRIHLASIWIVAFATLASAYFILAANSFMQRPVGYTVDETTGRIELTDFWAMLTNKVALITFPHTIAAAAMVAGAFVLAVAMWHITRHRHDTETTATFRTAAKAGAITTLAAAVTLIITGDIQGKIMADVQPMKMAAAEGHYETEQPADFSILTIGSLDGDVEIWSVKLPGLLSWLSTGDLDGEVADINDVQAEYEERFGPGDYRPNIPLTYWSYRTMVGLGIAGALLAAAALWSLRRGRAPTNRWLQRGVFILPLLPLAASSLGWIFRETGRQPWIAFTLMRTEDGVSPNVSLAEVATSLVVFTAIYTVLAIVEVRLLLRTAAAGLPPQPAPDHDDADADDRLTFAY